MIKYITLTPLCVIDNFFNSLFSNNIIDIKNKFDYRKNNAYIGIVQTYQEALFLNKRGIPFIDFKFNPDILFKLDCSKVEQIIKLLSEYIKYYHNRNKFKNIYRFDVETLKTDIKEFKQPINYHFNLSVLLNEVEYNQIQDLLHHFPALNEIIINEFDNKIISCSGELTDIYGVMNKQPLSYQEFIDKTNIWLN